MDERRHDSRDLLAIPVTVVADAGDEPGLTEDVSLMGVRLRTSREIPVGTKVRVVMPLPSQHLEGFGIVVRQCEPAVPTLRFPKACAVQLDAPLSPPPLAA